MHICIPDTREMRPPHGSAYLLYNVHIDGLYHCSLRFKQLLHLHQALSKRFSGPLHQMPQFPSKKLLPLSANQVEDRRQQLEKYLQNISQDKTVSNSSIFNLFLLEAQRESTRIDEKHVHLDIELVNGQKIRLPLMTHDSADSVLTAVCRALGLNDRYHAYFCLCLCGYDVVRDKLIIKRRLSFFEAPFITLQMAIQQQEQLQSVLSASSSLPSASIVAGTSGQTISNNIGNINNNLELNCSCLNCSQREVQHANAISTTGVPYQQRAVQCNNGGESIYHRTSNSWQTCGATAAITSSRSAPRSAATNRSFVTHRILLRKSYWDPIYDSYILNDQQALNLLFIQTVYDMKHSFMFVDRNTYQQLETLLANDSKLEYILLARTLKYYNYVHFEPCYSDYPRPRTKVMISIGSKELNMRVLKRPQSFRPASQSNLMQQQASSSPTPSPSQSPTPSTSTSPQTATLVSPIQDEARDQPVLYCTSSLVPSGYRDLITKDDLIEEEYNFKVPLIRCWRLTSLETLNSGNYNQQQQQQTRQATTTLAGGKRKSFSLFNSVVGSLNGSSDQHCRGRRQALSETPISNSFSNSDMSANETLRVNNIISSGTGGHSLMSTLISTSERNISNGNHSSNSTINGHSFPRFSSNHDSHIDCRPQFCSHENSHRPVGERTDEIDQTQLSQYELSFEYLVSKDKLQWITISSDQAIFISISLQGVVDELVSKRDCLVPNSDLASPFGTMATSGPHHQASSLSSSMRRSDSNASTPPISIMPSRNGSLCSSSSSSSSRRQKLSESFTYLYRDGAQKLLKTQSIDRFCATLGESSPQQASYLTPRRANGGAFAVTSGGALPQSAPTNSRHSTIMQAGFWNIDSRNLTTSPSRYLFGYSQPSGNHQSNFEIANVKKAPSPIINDAFEGVTDDDDM